MEISKETVDKYYHCLRTVNLLSSPNNSKILFADVVTVLASHGVGHPIFYRAVELGYFQKTAHGVYKSCIVPQPFHARKLAEYVSQKVKESKGGKKKDLPDPIPELSEQEAVAFLKSRGYKILKPVTEFQEV